MLLGGTGVAGRSTLPRLLSAGHAVTVHARSEAAAGRLANAGGSVARFDADDPEQLRRALRGRDAVIDHRVSLPTTSRAVVPGAWPAFRHLRDRATALLVDAMTDVGVERLVRDVVTFVYADGGDDWLDEAAPVAASGPMAANLAAEGHVHRLTGAGGAGVVLRCGLFYGPDDRMSREMVHLARRGLTILLGPGPAWHAALHTSDIGPAVIAALDAPPGTYNVVDDEPMHRSDLVALLAACAGRPRLHRPPAFVAALAGSAGRVQARSQRVSNQRFREATGWEPSITTRRSGWPAAFDKIT